MDRSRNKGVLKYLQGNPFFADLAPHQMRIVARYRQVNEIPPNVVLFRGGDDPDYVYYVLRRKLTVFKWVTAGGGKKKDVEVAELTKNYLFGELSVAEYSKRSATIFTCEPTLLLMIHTKHFNLLVKNQPSIEVILMRKVARLISAQLRNTTGRYADTKRVG
jgi:CRP-like cAMP-binding protein